MALAASPRRRTLLTWTPALVVPSLVVAAIVVVPMSAGAVSLPEKTPAEVIAMIEGSEQLAYTATVTKRADLGIPAIDMGASMMPEGAASEGSAPEGSDGAAAGAASGALLTSALEFFSGEHTARVSLDPEVGVRVQVYDRLAERNIVVNETEAWLYDSSANTATRVPLPDADELAAAVPDDVEADARVKAEQFAADIPTEFSTPAGVAQFVIDELDAESTVSMAANVRVADRAAYELRITPDASDTLVDSIALAVDAETGLPLRVVITAVNQDADAFSIAIDDLDLSTPDPALFTFTPPPGATVTEVPEFDPTADRGERPAETGSDIEKVDATAKPTVLQSGWATIVEIPAESMPEAEAANPLLDQFAVAVDGGSVVRTALLTVFLADDGRIFVGTVPLEALQSAANR